MRANLPQYLRLQTQSCLSDGSTPCFLGCRRQVETNESFSICHVLGVKNDIQCVHFWKDACISSVCKFGELVILSRVCFTLSVVQHCTDAASCIRVMR